MYQASLAKKLSISICGSNEKLSNQWLQILNDSILSNIKISPHFQLETKLKSEPNETDNLVFYLTTIDQILNEKSMIENYLKFLHYPRNRLFIIIDGCDNMSFDDDGDLTMADDNLEKSYQKFTTSIKCSDKTLYTYRVSLESANIWNKIIEEGSIVNLNSNQLDWLAKKICKKSSKLPEADKKREVKIALKKLSKEDSLAETGFTEISDKIAETLKLLPQKKMVYQNYLYWFNRTNICLKTEEISNLELILGEIYDIKYFKTEMFDSLTGEIDSLLIDKVKKYCASIQKDVSIGSNVVGSVDAYTYHQLLTKLNDIATGYNITELSGIIKEQLSTVDMMITDYHKKEMEKVTDLEKIASYLEIFAKKDNSNLNSLFEKIRSSGKIITENLDSMDKWIVFIDKCLKIGIQNDLMINLLEELILAKIGHYTDQSRINLRDLSVVYPQCLQTFLLCHLDKHFVFKKLYMFLSYSIRYSGRNISEFIKNLQSDQYDCMLLLENKLLQLCFNQSDERSQRVNPSDIEILECFNDSKSTKKKSEKKTVQLS